MLVANGNLIEKKYRPLKSYLVSKWCDILDEYVLYQDVNKYRVLPIVHRFVRNRQTYAEDPHRTCNIGEK